MFVQHIEICFLSQPNMFLIALIPLKCMGAIEVKILSTLLSRVALSIFPFHQLMGGTRRKELGNLNKGDKEACREKWRKNSQS